MSVGIELLKLKKLNNDNLVYTLHGDGELQEGQNWEAIMYALKKVDNLIATIDLNGNKLMVLLMKFYQWEVSELNLKLLTGMFLTKKETTSKLL
jgi:transketolase N-terminal domain/subunit